MGKYMYHFWKAFSYILNIIILQAVFCSLFLSVDFNCFLLSKMWGLIRLLTDRQLRLAIDLLSRSKKHNVGR